MKKSMVIGMLAVCFLMGCGPLERGVKIEYWASKDAFTVKVDGCYMVQPVTWHPIKLFTTKKEAIDYCMTKGLINSEKELK